MSDDYFKQLAKKKAKEEQESQEQNSFSYEEQNWTGFHNVGDSKVVRMVDPMVVLSPDDLKTKDMEGNFIYDQTTARVVNLVQLYDDAKRKRFMIVPDKNDDPGHIYWQLLNTVMEYEYVEVPGSDKKERKYIHREGYGKLFDRFERNGFGSNIHRNQFDRGWKLQKVLIANVIDREKLEKHRELKHTMLLSKNVNESDGKLYYDKGIPSYGVVEELLDIVSHYGSLNKYDLFIKRVGRKDQGFKIKNASIYELEVDEELQKFISKTDHLTEEELSWEKYDIEKHFSVSSPEKWFKNFKKLIKEVDLAFNKNFHDEIEELAEEAKQKRLAEKEAQEEQEGKEESAPTKEDETPKESTSRTRKRSKIEESSNEISWETIKKFDKNDLWKGEKWFDGCKELIEAIEDGDGEPKIIWKGSPKTEECFDDCTFESPSEVPGCLKCGEDYSE